MNTNQLNDVCETIIDGVTVGLHHPQFREAIITCMREFGEWQLAQFKAEQELSELKAKTLSLCDEALELNKNIGNSEPKQLSDEEIEKLAEKEYPIARNADLRMSNKTDQKRKSFIKGFKSALQTNVGFSEDVKIKECTHSKRTYHQDCAICDDCGHTIYGDFR